MSPENKKPKKVHEMLFKPEGYVSTDGIEFFEQLVEKLREAGFSPDDLIYSGMGAEHLYNPDGSVKRPNAIFAMNETGWVRAIKQHKNTPAFYAADSGDEPRIAIYDRRQLAHAYSYKMHEDLDDYTAPIIITDIVPGDALAGLPPSEVVEEVVIHKDYPQNLDASPTDALLAVVSFGHE